MDELEKVIAQFIGLVIFGWTITSTVLTLQDKIRTTEFMLHGILPEYRDLKIEKKPIVLLALKEYVAMMIIVLFLSGVILLVLGKHVNAMPEKFEDLGYLFYFLGGVLIVTAGYTAWRSRQYWSDKTDYSYTIEKPTPNCTGREH